MTDNCASVKSTGHHWALVIRPGAPALLGRQIRREVVVEESDFLPGGMMYRLRNPRVDEWVHHSLLTPLAGRTGMALLNLYDGSSEPVGDNLPWYVDQVIQFFNTEEE